jgi:uncharacterized protein (DUF4213/DUF364 family)
VVFTGKILFGPNPPLPPEFYIEILLDRILGALIRQVREASNHRNPGMSFKQLAGESIAESMPSRTTSLGFSNS